MYEKHYNIVIWDNRRNTTTTEREIVDMRTITTVMQETKTDIRHDMLQNCHKR